MTPHTAAKGLTGLLVDLRLYPEVASQRRHNWIFSFDRGRGDVVCYQYDCPALREKLRDAGFTVGIGSNSCIASMEHLGVLGANFGCGMTNYHDREASCDLAQLERQLERFVRFHRANRARRLPLSLATDRFATMRQPPIRSQERPPSSPMPGMRAFTPAELRRVVSSLRTPDLVESV